MRTIHLLISILLVTFLTNTVAAKSDSTNVAKKKTIVITDDGTFTTDSTFIYDDGDFKVLVKTLCDSFPMHRAMRNGFSSMQNGRARFRDDHRGFNYDFVVGADGDSSKVFVWHQQRGAMNNFGAGNMGRQPMMRFNKSNFNRSRPAGNRNYRMNKNMIDLNSPAIKSFNRETLKNGDEKITIVRKGKQ